MLSTESENVSKIISKRQKRTVGYELASTSVRGLIYFHSYAQPGIDQNPYSEDIADVTY